jgi:putative FmdB family regulatory protein
MAVYEYFCEECEEIVEYWTTKTDPTEARPLVCPKCGWSNSLTNKVSASRFDLKGKGWHETDYPSINRTPHKTVHAVGEPKGGSDDS